MVFVGKLCTFCTQNVLKIDCEYIILNELFVPVSGYLMRILLLLIQVQENENKTLRLLTSAFLWKASVFWFELILRISFPIKLR